MDYFSESEGNWLIRLLKGGFVLSLFAVLGLWVFVLVANLRHGEQQLFIWAWVPIAAGATTTCGVPLFMETGKAFWLWWSLAGWVPNILIFLAWGFLGH